MKKFLTVLLTLCLIASLSAMFAIGASAEEIEVTVGQKFEWNYQGEDSASQKAWRTGGGVSPDGLWKYQFYALEKGIYGNVVLSNDGYAWAKVPGNDGLGYARARDYGQNFHPGKTADIVKVFTCPSGGTISVDTSIARVTEWVSGKATATSFRVYLEDQLVYPTSGEYLSVVSTVPTPVNFEVEVQKDQRLYIHIGGIDGDIGNDAVIMSNTVTYKSINDNVATDLSEGNTLTFTRPDVDTEYADLTLDPDAGNGGNGGVQGGAGAEESSSMGLIIGIVAGVVVVVAVVVVVVAKKKQQ